MLHKISMKIHEMTRIILIINDFNGEYNNILSKFSYIKITPWTLETFSSIA